MFTKFTAPQQPLVRLLLAPLLLALLYLAAVALSGQRVASEVDRIESLLIARDDLSVVQFDYERGLWQGTLRYRLLWRPARSLAAAQPLLEALALGDERVTLAGSLDLRHGPWLGGSRFGLARLDYALPLPSALRDLLPQYPGKTPALTVTGTVGFAGNLRADMALVDYEGRVLDTDGVAQLQTAGIGAVLQADPGLTQLSLDLQAALLVLDVPDMASVELEGLRSTNALQRQEAGWQLDSRFSMGGLQVGATALVDVDDLALELDLSQAGSEPVLGDSRLALGGLRVNVPDSNLRLALGDYAATNHVALVDATVENTSAFTLRELRVNEQLLGGIAMETSARGITAQTYAALEALWPADLSDASLRDMATTALRALAAEQFVLKIDRLALLLPTEEDVSATLTLIYDGSADIDVESPQALLDATYAEASLEANVAAIDRTLASAGLDADQQQAVQELLDTLYEQPWVQLADGRLRTALQLQRGELLVNEQTLGSLSDLLATTTDADTAVSSGKKALQPQASAQCPDYNLDGTPLAYSSTALYSPQAHAVVAGGSADLGNCPDLPGYGFVAAAPDFSLDYSAEGAARALEFRVNSSCDSVLLINDPQGTWHYDDDSNGDSDALLRFGKAASGRWDIWVGAYGADGCDATLTLETF